MSLARRVFDERRRVVLPLLIFLALNLVVLGAVVWPLKQSLEGAAEARSPPSTRAATNSISADFMHAESACGPQRIQAPLEAN
jgi:hypothetical protein